MFDNLRILKNGYNVGKERRKRKREEGERRQKEGERKGSGKGKRNEWGKRKKVERGRGPYSENPSYMMQSSLM